MRKSDITCTDPSESSLPSPHQTQRKSLYYAALRFLVLLQVAFLLAHGRKLSSSYLGPLVVARRQDEAPKAAITQIEESMRQETFTTDVPSVNTSKSGHPDSPTKNQTLAQQYAAETDFSNEEAMNVIQPTASPSSHVQSSEQPTTSPSPQHSNISLVITPRESCNSCPVLIKNHRCKSACTDEGWDATSANYLLQSLNNTSILIIGDSISWQLHRAMACYTAHDSVNIHVEFQAMYLFPVDLESFRALVERNLAKHKYDTIVFALGTWYNINQQEDWPACTNRTVGNTTFFADANASTTRDILHMCCPGILPLLQRRKEEPYYAAQLMRAQCPDMMRRSTFVSGLKRLRDMLLANHAPSWPTRIIWKDIPPQHFDTLDGDGMFDIGNIKGRSRCAAIRNPGNAYERNKIANGILRESDNLSFVRTWDDNVDKWQIHPPGFDCTHFCNPSPLMWDWVTAVLKTIATSHENR